LIGTSLQRFYPLFFVDDSIQDIEVAQDNINLFNMTIILVCLIFFVLSQFFFRAAPPQPYGWKFKNE